MLPVKVGDVIEFDPLPATPKGGGGSCRPNKSEGRTLTIGRVVEVCPENEGGDGGCTVQVSPDDPLQTLDLKRTFYKVVFEAGKLRSLSAKMLGLEVELETVDTKRLECGTIEQVDCDINCALVLFGTGRKEWLDLSFFRVKFPGHQSPRGNKNNVAYTGENGVVDLSILRSSMPLPQIPKRHNTDDETLTATVSNGFFPREASLLVLPLNLPRVGPDQIDWQSEGTHVELCDTDRHFIEGATVCSKTRSHLQLYNEHRGFFEIACSVQAFKVVLHGLRSLKTLPMGQAIDVYSPMIGDFRSGAVLSAATAGRLTPIRFATNKSVEWVDLSSQTFKLVFIPHITDAFDHLDDHEERKVRDAHAAGNSTSPSQGSPRQHLPQHGHGHDSRHSQDLRYPRLCEGQRIELYDDVSKQYLKYNVVGQNNWSREAYMFEPLECPDTNLASQKGKCIISTLSRLRTRLQLQSDHWEEYCSMLVGQRVDVYDRVGKSVLRGKIIAVKGEGVSTSDPTVLVRFKNGHQSWLDVRTSKIKWRLPAIELTNTTDMTSPTKAEASPRANSICVTDFATSASSSSGHNENTSAVTTPSNPSAADVSPSKSEPGLFRIPSGEMSEEIISKAADSPPRKASLGKRMPALHRRASQSADDPKVLTQQLPLDTHLLSDPSSTKEEVIFPSATAVKTLAPIQPPHRQEDGNLSESAAHKTPSDTSLPPVQPASNPNSPGRTQVFVGPMQAAREPNVGLLASDHDHAACQLSAPGLHQVTTSTPQASPTGQ